MQEDSSTPKKRKLPYLIAGAVGVVIVLAVFSAIVFRAPQGADTQFEQFTISLDTEEEAVMGRLAGEGYVRHAWALRLALYLNGQATIEPGGYMISKSQNAWELASLFAGGPQLVWVTLPEGYRKEQMANILRRKLGWTRDQEIEWVTKHTALKADEIEGVYFPDTYLIPKEESPLEVADRIRARFNEKFAPLAKEAVAQNIRWPTLLKIASLVEREAAGRHDMPLVAGIIWNRLLANPPMRLDIDATVRYVRDSREHYGQAPGASQLTSYNPDGSWWETLTLEDKKIISPYNTYTTTGLPPHPIANPSLDAIKAALAPEKTDCFFYLHAPDKQIYCAKTYEEHKANIEKYLR